MPYQLHGATIYGSYQCSRCGDEGHIDEDAMEFVGSTWGIAGFECPKCGLNLDDTEEGEIDDQYQNQLDSEEEED